MTREELRAAVADFASSLTLMGEAGEKEQFVIDALESLREALAFRTEREFADHCRLFDARAVLARLDEESRRRRVTGALGPLPPEFK